jgi:hypothetical protein
MGEWPIGDEETFAEAVFRKRWLLALERSGVTTVGQLWAMPLEDLRLVPGIGQKTIADIAALLTDPSLEASDPLWCVVPLAGRVVSARDEALIRMRQHGVAVPEIARRFGISCGRVSQILDRDGWWAWPMSRALGGVGRGSAQPAAVGLDPFPTVGCGRWERQLEDRDRLPVPVTRADRNDLIAGRDVDARDRDLCAEHCRLEREREMLLDHREQAGGLF